MKSLVKSALSGIGLLEAARIMRSFAKGSTPSVLYQELALRIKGASDRLPLPSEKMMFTVISTRWASIFLDSGKKIIAALESDLQTCGLSLSKFESILDFGCGCGRLTRQLPQYTKARLFGCDYNSLLVEWCQANLQTLGEFKVNSLDPPLPYSDASFDFIFARSVFTHLPEQGQKAWMSELRRVLRPHGVLYFTTHGEQLSGHLTPKERDAFNTGQLVVQLANEAGRNICTSFELPSYVERNLLDGFKLLRFIPGSNEEHLRQDGYIVVKE